MSWWSVWSGAWTRSAALLPLLISCAGAAANHGDGPARTLRIVGGLGALNQYTRFEAPFWSQELHRLSSGRYSAEIVPFDRAGIRSAEMLALLQSGVVPFGTVLLSAASGSSPVLGATDLAGLNPDMGSLQRSVAAFRPFLARELRERHGVELLAVYSYPAQVLFCNKAIGGWRSLAGLRVRVSSASQADLVLALGGKPTLAPFAEVVPNLRAGNIDCAVTGTMSGYTVALYEHTTHLHAMALNWDLAVFVAHSATWAALPADLRALLQRELPRLEQRIWADSQRETGEGVACNTGSGSCTEPRLAGSAWRAMAEVPVTAADHVLRRELFARTVLPRWLQRCGAACAAVWNSTLAEPSGVPVRP